VTAAEAAAAITADLGRPSGRRRENLDQAS
jgi:hypothetical protein